MTARTVTPQEYENALVEALARLLVAAYQRNANVVATVVAAPSIEPTIEHEQPVAS